MSTALVPHMASLVEAVRRTVTPQPRQEYLGDDGIRVALARLEVATRRRDAEAFQRVWSEFAQTDHGRWMLDLMLDQVSSSAAMVAVTRAIPEMEEAWTQAR